MVSQAMEDYLAAIWRLTQHGGVATTSEVARRLKVTAASTSAMFRKMADAGLVEYREYSGASLTAAGETAAMGYIRRHRLTERFLVDILGISWERADALSDQMEHSLPDEVLDRMDAVLGHPDTCPHGFPIPTREGHLQQQPMIDLTMLPSGETATVAQVAENDPDLLAYFGRHGLRPGAAVSMVERDATAQTYTLQVGPDGARLILGKAVAALVRVGTTR